MKQEDLRYYLLVHFSRWASKSPLYFDNIKAELPGFVEVLKEYLKENNITSFNMDWVLNMTPKSVRNKLKKIQEAKDELEFPIWENKVTQTIKQASEEELLYYAVRMYLDLKDHPFALIPEPQQVKKHIELSDFLYTEEHRDKLPKIKERFKNSIGKEMAIAIYLLNKNKILTYEYGSKTKGRKQLVEALNANVKMNGVNKHFISNTEDLNIGDKDIKALEEWLSGL